MQAGKCCAGRQGLTAHPTNMLLRPGPLNSPTRPPTRHPCKLTCTCRARSCGRQGRLPPLPQSRAGSTSGTPPRPARRSRPATRVTPGRHCRVQAPAACDMGAVRWRRGLGPAAGAGAQGQCRSATPVLSTGAGKRSRSYNSAHVPATDLQVGEDVGQDVCCHLPHALAAAAGLLSGLDLSDLPGTTMTTPPCQSYPLCTHSLPGQASSDPSATKCACRACQADLCVLK